MVAVSGGADSVALLHLLARLAPAWRLRLHVLHVDHGLREGSARDAELVRALGARLAVPVDVATVTVAPSGSLEAAARRARYDALEAAAERVGAQRIATGHTADDQAETVLMRLVGGTGVRGLAGIPPVRGRVIRPLIACHRAALVEELVRAGIEWVEDPTNADPRFLRNRIRHELLPRLVESYNPAIVEALVRLAGRARETVSALERAGAAELARLAVFAPGAVTLPLAELRALPRPAAAEVLRQAAAALGGHAPLRAWAHRGLRRLLAAPPPRRAFRLGGVTLEASGPRVRLAVGPLPDLAERRLSVPGRLPLPEIGKALEATLAGADRYALPREKGRAAFDADALPGALVVRARRPGDRLEPFGGGERKLKGLLIDAKVPRWERGRIPLVEAHGRILWVAGVRRGAAAPVTARTRRVLELALLPLAEPHAGR